MNEKYRTSLKYYIDKEIVAVHDAIIQIVNKSLIGHIISWLDGLQVQTQSISKSKQ